jgi:chromosome segregation ATPase
MAKGNGDFSLGDYTIDLAKLGQSSAGGRDLFAAMGGSEIETPVRVRPTVDSDDEGPEDFTINLGKYMKGEGSWERQEDMEHMPSPKPISKERDLFETVPSGEYEENSVIVHKPTLLPNNQESKPCDQTDEPHITAADEFQRPKNEPQPAWTDSLHIEFERLKLEAESYRREIDVLDDERAQLEAEKEELASKLNEMKQSLERSEKRNCDNEERWARELEKNRTNVSNVSQLRAKFEPLTQELEVAKKHAETLKQESDREIAALSYQLQVARDQNKSLLKSETKLNATMEELENLRIELARIKQDFDNRTQQPENEKDTLKHEVEELQTKLEAAETSASTVTVLNRELVHTQEQLTESRRVLDAAEDENDRFTQENERLREDISQLKNELVNAGSLVEPLQISIQEKESKLAELERTIEQYELGSREESRAAQHDNIESINKDSEKIDTVEADMRLADQLDTLSGHYEAEITSLKEAHKDEVKKLKATLFRAAEGMRKRETRITNDNGREIEALRQEIASLKQNKASNPTKPESLPTNVHDSDPKSTSSSSDTKELRTAIQLLATKLKDAQSEILAARKTIQELQEQADLQQQKWQEREEDHAAVNEALDERYARTFKEREREWQRRIKLVLRDRDTMAKVLLWQWGKEEVGLREVVREGEGMGEGSGKGEEKMMGYRYQFVKR